MMHFTCYLTLAVNCEESKVLNARIKLFEMLMSKAEIYLVISTQDTQTFEQYNDTKHDNQNITTHTSPLRRFLDFHVYSLESDDSSQEIVFVVLFARLPPLTR